METLATMRGKERKADRVAESLMRRIVDGTLDVGDLLPKELELAEEFQVNKSVIREAVKLLEVHRLVRPIKRRGTEVLSPLASMSPDVLRAMLFPQPNKIDLEVLSDVLEIRASIDRDMSRLAAERRTHEDLAAMDECLSILAGSMEEPKLYARLMNDLALIVARATHNRIYEMLVHWHRAVYADLEDLFLAVREPNEGRLQALQLLVELIRQQDIEGIGRAVEAYHLWATPRIKAAAAIKSGAPLESIMEENK